jgi:SHS2 domain-containing protein
LPASTGGGIISEDMNDPAYRFFDHGADLGVLFSGRDVEDLLRNGARALMSVIVERKGIGPEVTKIATLEDGEDLPVRFLNELLYLFDVDRFVAEDLTLEREGGEATFTLRGTTFERGRDRIKKEVKAATYHGFAVEQDGPGLTARVVLDI